MDSIKNKPLRIKLKILWTIVGVSMVCLVGIWILSKKISPRENTSKATEEMTKTWNKAKNHWTQELNQTSVPK